MRSARPAAFVAIALLLVSARGRGEPLGLRDAEELVETMAGAGARVEAFFSRAQSLICTETVSIRPIDPGAGSPFGRTIESELRLWWEAAADGGAATAAQTKREVRTVNRRPPQRDDPRSCTVPEQEDTETPPLAMLLPGEREAYRFTPAGSGRVDGRAVVIVDFRHLAPVAVKDVHLIEDNEDCVAYDVSGGFRGRLWIDRETRDVLRLDSHLGGLVDVRLPPALLRRPDMTSSWTLERWDTSIRFGQVRFDEPSETLVLPLKSTTVQVTRGGRSSRLRTETKYANYKRFLTSARIIGPS